MSIEIIINATEEETRVAILENKTVTEFYVDRKKDRGIVGNVYKGKVVKVLPGMQAAFVDIGQEKAAFLYVSDVRTGADDYGKLFEEDPREKESESEEEGHDARYSGEEPEAAGETQGTVEETSEDLQGSLVEEAPFPDSALEDGQDEGETEPADLLDFSPGEPSRPDSPEETISQDAAPGEVPLPVFDVPGKDLSPADVAVSPLAVELDQVVSHPPAQEVLPQPSGEEVPAGEPVAVLQAPVKPAPQQGKQRSRNRGRFFRNKPKQRRVSRSIEELLKEGQDVVVQVSKDAMGTKGPRVTTYISLPGRYLVFMPNVNHIGISRRIGGGEERGRLKEMLHRLRRPGSGYIIRTVSEGTTEEEFRSDMEFLEALWQSLSGKKEQLSAPALLHVDLDLIFRTVRDLFTKKVDKLVIDNRAEYERIKDYAQMYLKELAGRIELYSRQEPIFDAFEIEPEISRAIGRKVWLKSGGYLIIDRTEALTVIDVNTGRYVGKRDLEETILKTNLEALKEIAFQLRLRNIGGIIITDFIDMEKEKNRERVFQALQEAMSKDRAKVNIQKISDLGLIELSRERTRDDLQRILCEPCFYCEGKGYVRSATTICYEIFREIRRVGGSPREKKIIVTAHPSVANLLYDDERQGIEELEKRFKKRIVVKPDHAMHLEHYNVLMV